MRMKKFLLTSLAALFAVVSFAQPRVMKHLPSSDMLRSQVVEKKITPMPSLKGVTAPERTKVLGKAVSRRAQLSSIDDLNGDFVVANYEYDVDSTMQFIPADVAYSGSGATIEVTGENTIAIYGFTPDATNAINATIDLETGTISIPSGQVLFTDEEYGDIFIQNVTSEGDLKGTVYEGGIIALEDLWIDALVYQGETYYWGSFFHFSNIAPANGVMEYEAMTKNGGEYEPQTLNVLIVQDEDTKEVTVFNFSVWGLGATITLNSDKTFVLSSDNAVDYGGTGYGLYYIVGVTAKGSLYLDVPGKGTATTLKSDDYWSLYSYEGYWRFAQSPFTITLIDGTEFEYPEAETGELVVLPEGLTPVAMPCSYAIKENGERVKKTGTVNVAVADNAVYFQGIDLQIPEAWVKGTLDAESGIITIPVTYTGVVNETSHFFGGYGSKGEPVDFIIEYNAKANTYYGPDWVEFFKSSTGNEDYYYGGLFIGENKPTPYTMPETAVAVEKPFTGSYYDFDTGKSVDMAGNVKVAKEGNLVYIQGLYSNYFDNDCIIGQMIENEGSKYVMIPAGEYVGELASGFQAFLLSYTYNQATESTSLSNIVFIYDETNDVYTLGTPLVLSRSSKIVNLDFFVDFITGLTIGTDPSGIAVTKSDTKANGQMYNLAGQKVGKDYKGMVIVNGRKFMNK